MEYSQVIDFFETNCYNSYGDFMKDFMNLDFNITKIAFACYVPPGTTSVTHNNRPSHGLAIFLGGDRTFIFRDGKKLRLSGNGIVYFPKGSSYVVQTKISGNCYAINFDIEEKNSFEPFVFELNNTEHYLELFKSSQKRWSKRDTGYVMKVKSDLYDIIYRMKREYSNLHTKGAYGKIKPAIDYIHSNYLTETISVSFLAKQCGMSEVYLRSLFMKSFNLSPNKYIKNLKLKRAEELLMSDLYSVSEVCFLSGFSDESFFSREFKKHFNATPGEFIKASRK